jgi:hypothetical protein
MLHKENMFKTAYSPFHKNFVELVGAHQDDRGEWIFVGKVTDSEDGRVYDRWLFRTHELERFVL